MRKPNPNDQESIQKLQAMDNRHSQLLNDVNQLAGALFLFVQGPNCVADLHTKKTLLETLHQINGICLGLESFGPKSQAVEQEV